MLSLTAVAVATLLGASTLASAAHPAAQAPAPCDLVASMPHGIGLDRLGDPAYEIDSSLTCPAQRWQDVRICPQQLVSGVWQDIPGSGGWASRQGTCIDASWYLTTTTSMMDQYVGVPGQTYRTWAQYWTHKATQIKVSAPYICCAAPAGASVARVRTRSARARGR